MAAPSAALRQAGEGVAELCAHLGNAGAPDGPLGPALSRLDFVAALPNPAAPPYVYFAGSCLGTAVGGGGASALEAAGRLAGEAAEMLALAGDAPPGARNEACCLLAVDLATGRETAVRRADVLPGGDAAEPALPFGLGLAAGPDRDAARRAGLLELVERDAAARWWNDGTRPRQPDPATLGPAGDLLASLRGPAPKRATTLLALDGVAGIPVLCALSRGPDGRGLAFGLKAAIDPAEAARGAVIECLQMEIALDLARLRAKRGSPGPADAAVLARAGLDVGAFAAFQALPTEVQEAGSRHANDLVGRLVEAGHRPVAVDLPDAPAGFAVARVFAPGLRPLPGGAPGRSGTPGAQAELM